MKILYFRKNSSNIFFCDSCFYASAQKFRVLDYVILLYATVLSMILKRPVGICF